MIVDINKKAEQEHISENKWFSAPLQITRPHTFQWWCAVGAKNVVAWVISFSISETEFILLFLRSFCLRVCFFHVGGTKFLCSMLKKEKKQ